MSDLEWKMAKEWIRSTGIEPVNGKAFEQSVDLFDFAQSLRDGVILCQVANQLKMHSIRDVSKVNNVNMHMFLCLRNIRAFLRACSEEFKLDQDDLFTANDLYDVSNFQAVIHTLSLLSKTYEAKVLCKLKPFPPDNFKTAPEEDIYGTLPEILEKKEPNYYSYDDYEEENIYDHVQIGEKIYDDIVQCTKKAGLTPVTDKRSYIINEIIQTEDSYLEALNVMVDVYMKQLKGYMSAHDKNTIFMNTEKICILHKSFNRDLTTRRTSTNVKLNLQSFVQYKEQFLQYAVYCTDLPDAQQHTIELFKEPTFRDKVESCNSKASRKFPLQEQLVVPFQRILKYPLLLRDLNKQTPATHEEKKSVEKAFEAMDDVARYINEYKRDAENVKLISQIESSVKYDLAKKPIQYGHHVKNGELQVKFDTSDKKILKRFVFLFEHTMLLCKSRGDTYDVKEVFDLQKFKIGDIPPAGRGKFSQGWFVQAHTNDGVCEAKNCTMYAKTQQDKITWVSELSKCIEAVSLTEWQGKMDHHNFELTTFESPQCCHVCKKLLRGQISQGYKCSICRFLIHKECLIKCPKCGIKRPTRDPTIHESSIDKPKRHDLSKLPTNDHLPSSNSLDLKKYPWYAGVLSRDEAAQILVNYGDGAFLIRESPNQPGLAISIRYKADTKHIKIGHANNRVFLTDPKQFPSIADLVMYYKSNSLGTSFPSLPTKLTRGVARAVKRVMIAKFNWAARNPQELSFQMGDRVSVLSDEGNWWLGECRGKEGFFPNNYVE